MSEILDPLAGVVRKKKKKSAFTVSWLQAFIISIIAEKVEKVFSFIINYRTTKVP